MAAQLHNWEVYPHRTGRHVPLWILNQNTCPHKYEFRFTAI